MIDALRLVIDRGLSKNVSDIEAGEASEGPDGTPQGPVEFELQPELLAIFKRYDPEERGMLTVDAVRTLLIDLGIPEDDPAVQQIIMSLSTPPPVSEQAEEDGQETMSEAEGEIPTKDLAKALVVAFWETAAEQPPALGPEAKDADAAASVTVEGEGEELEEEAVKLNLDSESFITMDAVQVGAVTVRVTDPCSKLARVTLTRLTFP